MKKKLSKFICRELLYDYISGVLDANRKNQVEEYINEDSEIKAELETLEMALRYTSQLKKITLSQPYHQKLRDVYQKEGQTYYIKKAGKRSAQMAGLCALLALLYLYFPADKIINYFKRDPNKIVIAEIKTTGKLSGMQPIEVAEDEPESLLSAEEDAAQSPEHSEGEEQEVKLSPEQEKKLREELDRQESEQQVAIETEAKTPVAPVPTPSPRKGEVKTSGFVYRAFLAIDTKDAVADAVTQRIESLGGAKAGSVEIGWEKPNGSRYFHFTITESNFEILKAYLNTIAPIEVAKSPHPRVMPTGQVRMILEVQSP